MVKIEKNKWKPVQLSSSIFAGNIDGLIGIEECTDYDLDAFKFQKFTTSKTKEKVHKNKKKLTGKSKKSQINNELGLEESSQHHTDILLPSKGGTTETKAGRGFQVESAINLDSWSIYGLQSSILLGLKEQNFSQPTEIQELTLPAAIFGKRDILGAAETGSGKTLAFGLPILSGILKLKETLQPSNEVFNNNNESDSEEELYQLNNSGLGCVKTVKLEKEIVKPLYALILTPTRELAMQIKNHLSVFSKYTGINVAVIVGGMASVKQERILNKGPEIVIATPGRLWELIQSGNNHLSQVDNIRFFAIDETDRMLERGHFQELHNLLERLNLHDEQRKQRQNFVFSATLTLVHDLPKHLINKSRFKSKKISDMSPAQKLQKIIDMLGITEPKVVDITKGTGTSGTLIECRITCSIEEKDYYVYYFLQKHPGRTLIFCNSIGCVKRLTTLLSLLQCNPLPLHASMQQRRRLENLEKFRDTENGILVATDVAARGLDIPLIEHVLHYQTPRTSESYVHRSGRTARATKQGIAILLMEPNEFQNYLKLCKTLGKEEDLPTFPVQNNFLNAVKQRVNLARDLDKLQLLVRKTNSESGWLQKAAEDMDIVMDDLEKRFDFKEMNYSKRAADIKRKQLQSLLSKPIFPKGISGKYPLFNEEMTYSLLHSSQKEEKAIDVMKHAMESQNKLKKKSVSLYKAKLNNVKNSKGDGVIKLTKFKNSKQSQKNKVRRK